MQPMFDIAIAGGGATGLSLALALRRLSGGGLRVVLFDTGADRSQVGPRASAIAAGPKRMLENLGVWTGIQNLASPIKRMEISDTRLEDLVRTPLLRFDTPSDADEPLAHMVFHHDLEPHLAACAHTAGVQISTDRIISRSVQGHSCVVHTAAGLRVGARLVIAADGGGSQLRNAAGIGVLKWPYDRRAIVATIQHEHDHHDCATQHFLPGGPFALLPLRGRRSSLVWTEPTSVALGLMGLSKSEFIRELEQRAGLELGVLEVADGPVSFDLVFQLARSFVAPRMALVGDAAHRVHPLAGQGLNLGLRDVAWLAELILDQARLGLDFGSDEVLAEYQRVRRFDSAFNSAAFDVMHRVFAMDATTARLARGAALASVNQLDRIKRIFQGEASGRSAGSPRLFSA